MQRCNRRIFLITVATTSAALVASRAVAADPPTTERVTEADPYAKSMGFRLDTTKVDKVKYPRHEVSQKCSNCQLYDGKPGEPLGPCSFYGGRLVAPDGWCRNFKVVKAKA